IFSFFIYIVWRWYMQGEHLFRGYSNHANNNEYYNIILANINNFSEKYQIIMQWNNIHFFIITLLSIFILFTLIKKQSPQIITIIICGLCVFAPIIPVINILTYRYLLLITLSLYIFIIAGLYFTFLWQRKILIILLGITILMTGFYSSKPLYLQWWSYHEKIKAEGQFMLLNKDEQRFLVTSDTHCLGSYKKLRGLYNNNGNTFFSKNYCFASLVSTNKEHKFVKYIDGKITSIYPDLKNCIFNKNIHIKITYENSILYWDFGPWQEGKYIVELDNQQIEINQKGNIVFAVSSKPMKLRVIYQGENGFSISDMLTIYLEEGFKLDWINKGNFSLPTGEHIKNSL
ncbi:hypothetical protein QUF61_13820, partial [Candidatus Venteria ishoeyi]|uniref:hypothetical protein n=1 Tax=Candidatus Venteria ishoeyi TaxID=1899563 RepID=UPI0025A5EB07